MHLHPNRHFSSQNAHTVISWIYPPNYIITNLWKHINQMKTLILLRGTTRKKNEKSQKKIFNQLNAYCVKKMSNRQCGFSCVWN